MNTVKERSIQDLLIEHEDKIVEQFRKNVIAMRDDETGKTTEKLLGVEQEDAADIIGVDLEIAREDEMFVIAVEAMMDRVREEENF